ncbi:MAG: hypothetical protein J6E38_09075 [Clostridia bacterium]|nr:hypothetical protein [Clostridia bacterium]
MKSITKILIAIFVLTVMSLTALASPSVVTVFDTAEETPYADETEELVRLMGDGTEESPYLISCTVEFNNFSALIKNDNASYGSKYYKLTANVDFADAVLVPFGTSSYPFTGTFDGNGYSIYNVSINNVENSGIIGYMTDGTVKNLSVSYKDMETIGNYSDLKFFGGIVGNVMPASSKTVTIEGCSTDGDIVLKDSNTVYAGGIVGQVKAESGNLQVTNCVSYMSFDAQAVSDSYVGGLVAYAKAGSSKDFTFKNCVSFGDVKLISNTISSTVAGFAAYVNKDETGWSGWASEDEESELAAVTTYHFENCAAFGNAYGEAPKNVYVGGFIAKVDGSGTVTKTEIYRNSSQTVNGSVGKVIVNTLATATASENFKTQEFYSATLGFDFNNMWYMSEADDIPCLRTVAKSYGAMDVTDTKSVRLSDSGLRFRASIEAFKRDYCFEYGFIVARKDELGSQELTFDFKGRKVIGVAYDSETDIYLSKDDDTITFTGVVFNIPKANYATELVARAYVKFVSEGETVILYGDTTSSSINMSAQAVKDSESYEYLTDEQKAILETMLPEA